VPSSASDDAPGRRTCSDLGIGEVKLPRTKRPASVTWLGHATVLLELDGLRVLTDPVLRPRIGPLVRIAPLADEGALAPVDCVLLSHLHADHADPQTLRRVARGAAIIAPDHAARWLHRIGLRHVQELRAGDEATVGGLRVTATPATHDRRRRPFGPAADPVGYVVRGSRSAYFAGDTDLFAAMAELRDSLDLALLPVWGWGRDVGRGHLDPDTAARAAAIISPEVAIPIHWGTFALARPARRSADPEWPAREFAARAREYAPDVEVRVLAPGEQTGL
jgi:L-ascorbate metabolism protein UlaG (beta-lactamase superfamily)